MTCTCQETYIYVPIFVDRTQVMRVGLKADSLFAIDNQVVARVGKRIHFTLELGCGCDLAYRVGILLFLPYILHIVSCILHLVIRISYLVSSSKHWYGQVQV